MEGWENGGSHEHRTPPASAVWYVADEDTQVGPISVAEVEERCLAGELGATAMAWSSGMSDWLPLADVPELAHLAPVSAEPGRLTDDESWTPISAEELASLAAAVVSPESRKPPRAVEVKPAGFGEPVAWSVPVAPPLAPPARSRRVPLAYAAGVGGAAVIGAFVALFFAREVAPPASGVSAASDRMRPQSDAAARGSGGHAPSPVVDETAGEVAPEAEVEPEEPEVKVEEAKAQPAAPERRRPRELCQSVACSGHGQCVVRAGKARCSCDAGFRNAGPTRCVAEPKAPVLDKDAITGVVAERKSELRPCLARARKPAAVAAGRYAMVVSWMIRADGSVGQVRWRRPDWARSTSLPACFADVIRTWRFPAPGRDFAVNNFPLGNVTLK